MITTEGLNDMLTNYFKGVSYTAAWFVGLIDDADFTARAITDTAAKITTSTPSGGTNGWKETTAYAESTRQALTLGTASAGSIDNSASKAVVTMNATKTVNGVFVVSASTKGATTGKMYSTNSFSAPRPLGSGDVLTITQTETLASTGS